MLFNGGIVSVEPVPGFRSPLEPRAPCLPNSVGAVGPAHIGWKSEASPISRPKIVIQGWYGNGNLGDEIILECMLSELRGHFPEATFVVVSDDPADTKRRHGVESIPRGGGRMQRLKRLRALTDADLFILGGGELLKQFGSSDVSILTWLGPLELAHEMGVPTMTYAVGVSDRLSSRAEAVMKGILSKTDAVLVRDPLSFDVLRRIGVPNARLTADPALLFPELHQEARGRPAPGELRVSVFVNEWFVTRSVVPDPVSWQRFKNRMAECVDGLIERYGATVRFVPMQVTDSGEDDRTVAREIAGLTRNRGLIEVREERVSANELLGLISGSNLVISMRLHSLILATALGVPALAIEYQSKVKRFSDSIGTSDWVIGITDSNSDSMLSLCSRAASGSYPLALVKERLPTLQDLARENANLAAALVRQPRKRSNRLSRAARGSLEVVRRIVGRKERRRAPESVQVNAVYSRREREAAIGQGTGSRWVGGA